MIPVVAVPHHGPGRGLRSADNTSGQRRGAPTGGDQITTPERSQRGFLTRRVRHSLATTLERLLPFQDRLGLHLAVLTLVASAVLIGGRMYATARPSQQGVAGIAIGKSLVPVPESLAVVAYAPIAAPSPAVSAPSGSAPAASPKGQDETRPDALPQPNPVAALSIQDTIRGVPDLPGVSQGQEDGVMATRAMPSSRGGDRAPAPSASPTSIPPTPTPVPPPPPAPVKQAMKAQTYKVQEGDTLLAIAARFGITPETVLWANNLGNGELLQIGEELTILPVSGVLHSVGKGETLGEIAEAHLADVGKLMDANALEDADKLQEGQVLIIPGGMMTTTEVPGLPSAPSARELASAPRYAVKQGDTLLSIADAFGVRPSVIQVANNLLNPDMLQVGAELSIPGGKVPAPKAQQGTPPAPAPAARPAAPAPTAKAVPPPPPPAPAPAPAASGTATGDHIAALSQRYVGYRYVWGGTSPNTGFDCSGFVWYVYKQAGVSIPRAPLEGQLGAGPRISMDKLLPGDLVFWQNTYKAGLSHVGIYLGGGRFINAESEAVGVQIRSLSDPFWAARYVGAARPW